MTTPSVKAPANPTVSRVEEDGSLVELLYDPASKTTSLAHSRPDGSITIGPSVELADGERLIPYSPNNNLIATGTVLLPSDVGDIGDKGDVVRAIQSFLHRYVDLSPAFAEIAPYYVLLTWVYDAFNELPYLRFRGDYGTGKTRGLLAVGSICYKPFFASGASTVSPIFHILDTFQGTLILDEADMRFSDATAELTKVLNNGNMRGLPVLRTMTNRHRELNPQAFRVFGPKIIGMRHAFTDRALESRFLTEETGARPLRSDIPIHLPDSLHTEATQLRNQLLAFRFRYRGSVAIDPSRAIAGVEPRTNQTALALLSLVDDVGLRARIATALAWDADRLRQDRADTLEATMITALVDTFAAASAPYATVGDAAERFNRAAGSELGRPMTNRWVGGFIRNRLRLVTMKSRGVYVVPQSEKPKVDALAKRFCVGEIAGEREILKDSAVGF